MRRKLLALAIALACLAAPALGALPADDCSPCCAHSALAPCERGEGPCTTLGKAPCCDAAPVAPASPALRLLESLAAPAVASGTTIAPPRAPSLRGLPADVVVFPTSPLRLSVVLQI